MCNDESCRGLTVYCEDLASCTFGTGTDPLSFTEIDCVSHSGSTVTMSPMSVACPTVIEGVTAKKELEQNEISRNLEDTIKEMTDKVLNPDDVSDGKCLLERECAAAVLPNGEALCYGYQSCEQAQLDETLFTQCYGAESCSQATAGAATTHCAGKSACESMTYPYPKTGTDSAFQCMGEVWCHVLVA